MGKRKRRAKVHRRNKPKGGLPQPVKLNRAATAPHIIIGGVSYAGSEWLHIAINNLAEQAGGLYHSIIEPARDWQPVADRHVNIIRTTEPRRGIQPAVVLSPTCNLLDSIAAGLVSSDNLLKHLGQCGSKPSVAAIAELDYWVGLSFDWASVADVTIHLDELLEDPVWYIDWLNKMLFNNTEADTAAVLTAVAGGTTKSFDMRRTALSPWLTEFIATRYANWFKLNGYEVEV